MNNKKSGGWRHGFPESRDVTAGNALVFQAATLELHGSGNQSNAKVVADDQSAIRYFAANWDKSSQLTQV